MGIIATRRPPRAKGKPSPSSATQSFDDGPHSCLVWVLCDELHVRSASPNLGFEPDNIAMDGGDHVDHRSNNCPSCLRYGVGDTRVYRRTGVGHPATTSHQPAPIRALGTERPDRRPRGAQKILSSGKARWAQARIPLTRPVHARTSSGERLNRFAPARCHCRDGRAAKLRVRATTSSFTRRSGRRPWHRTRHTVALRSDQRHARVHQVLLRVEDVKGGALADAGLLAHAVERDLHLRLGGVDLRLGGWRCWRARPAMAASRKDSLRGGEADPLW